MYGQNPAYAPAAFTPGASMAMAPYFRPQLVFGADAAPAQSFTDKAKEFLAEETLGVKNQWWLLGAAALGLGWYGHSQRWF